MEPPALDPAALDPAELDRLADLEQRVLASDGTPLKLEWPYIRDGRTVASLVCRDGDRIVGFLGLYSFGGPPDVELVGMVDPLQRRRGLATALLARGLEICRTQRLDHRLLVIPRASDAGRAFALKHGAELEHSEHSMLLQGEPRRTPEDANTTLRDATEADRADRERILSAGFGPPPESMLARIHGAGVRTVIIEHGGRPIGTASLSLDAGRGSIHGFAIDTDHRGRGIGHDALGRFCAELKRQGARTVRLEVAVENDRALQLYTSTGFVAVGTEDYYLLPARGPASTG